MTIEERKDRFSKFDGCIGVACRECSYYQYKTKAKDCRELIHEDARAIIKDMADKQTEETIKTIIEDNRPPVFKAPLTTSDLELIEELIRLKTEVPDISAHFIQEVNELCAELNGMAAIVGKLEQLRKGTDPVGEEDNNEAELIYTVGLCVSHVIEEAADVYNYLCVMGYTNQFSLFINHREEKLARWANRLNGVSDE